MLQTKASKYFRRWEVMKKSPFCTGSDDPVSAARGCTAALSNLNFKDIKTCAQVDFKQPFGEGVNKGTLTQDFQTFENHAHLYRRTTGAYPKLFFSLQANSLRYSDSNVVLCCEQQKGIRFL
jgi:hypothetical protein